MGRAIFGDFEDLLPKLKQVFAEIERSDQDLQRHRQALSIALESIKRYSESIEREIEASRLQYKRFEEIYEILKSLHSSPEKAAKIDPAATIEQAIEDRQQEEPVNSSSTTTSTDKSDGDAAKLLIDFSAQEETALQRVVAEPMEAQSIDVGCRFNPTDQELIRLLKDKIAGKSITMHIRDWNLYGNDDPATIFGANPASELYFVTQMKKKFVSGKRNSRVVGNGTWKIQSNRSVYEDATNKKKIIGEKRALNFVDENTKKDKISWIMHEYNLCSSAENPDRWVICRIKRGKGNRIGLDSLPSSIPNANDDEVQNANDEDERNAGNDEELRQLKKRRVHETLDLSLSIGLPSENHTQDAPQHARESHPSLSSQITPFKMLKAT